MSDAHAASAWGDKETEFFYDLTPDRILAAAEKTGVRCTGRLMQMNSMENRVWEVEIEVPDESALKSRSEKARILKFYRPGRWSRVQIEEEHRFLLDLKEAEVPVVAPIAFAKSKGKGKSGGETETLASVPGASNLFFAAFPKVGGRHPDEMDEEQLVRVGRQLGRMHNVGAAADAPHRLRLTPEVYGYMNLDYLLETEAIPERLEEAYVLAAEEICGRAEELFAGFGEGALQRIHGDCHLGNLLWADSPPHDGPFWLDFDDMVVGPPVQDVWLIVPGRDEDAIARRDQLLRGYEEMRSFDRATLRLIEPLRALRYIHFSAWIAKRWSDPAFPRRFEQFGTETYWAEQVADLREQVDLMRAGD